jgi:hypothetical protein
MVTVNPKNEHSVPVTVTPEPASSKLSRTLSAHSCRETRWDQTANASRASSAATTSFWTTDFMIQNDTTAPTASAVATTSAIVLASSRVRAIIRATVCPRPTLDVVSDQPIHFSAGLPTTVLPAVDAELAGRLAEALDRPADERRAMVAEVVASAPRYLDGWAELGDLGRDTIERYAAYRVGYHRGLDALRANGWRGSGYVRWTAPTNRGFLRSLRGLGEMAAEIGETDEAERCRTFLLQLDPTGIPAD